MTDDVGGPVVKAEGAAEAGDSAPPSSDNNPSGRRMRSRAPMRIPDDAVPGRSPSSPPPPPSFEEAPLAPLAPMRIITIESSGDANLPPDPPTRRNSSLPPAPGTHAEPDPGWTPAASHVHMSPPFAAPQIEEISDDDVSPDSDSGETPPVPPPRPPAASRPDGPASVPPPPPMRPPSMSRPGMSDLPPPRPPSMSRPPPAEVVPAARPSTPSEIDVVEEPAEERVSAADIEEIAPAPVAAAPPVSVPPSTKESSKKRVRPWWEEMFDDDLLRTVERLSEKQIISEAIFIEDRLGLQKGAIILDLACGEGRHAVELTRRGYKVVGYDLSLAMLARASDEAEEASQKINFLHGDMREMAFESMFDGVYCWGMSFGFFEEDKNFQVIQRIHRALRPGGVLLLDVVNRDFVAARQPSMVWFEGEGCVCMDEMQVDFITSRLKVKRTVMLDDGRSRELDYSIRLYGLHELGKMLHDAGFKVLEVSGQIATPGVFFGSESPRCVVLAERS